MSGPRPDTTGIYGNLGTHKIVTHPQTQPTLPYTFRTHGYTSLSFGKTTHGKETEDGAGWSSEPWLAASGWECYVNFKGGRGGSENEEGGRAKPAWRPVYEIYDGTDSLHNDYQTADHVIQALESQSKSGKPFFIASGFWKPHMPFVAPKRYWDLYDHSHIDLVKPFGLPKGASDLMYRYSELWGYGIEPGVAFSETNPPTEEQARNMIRAYYAATSFTDAQIGRVLQRLEELKLADDTAVVIWGDNGYHLGDHARWGKHTQFEQAARTPLIVRFPGRQKTGLITSALVEAVDIYPSLCDWAGLKLPGDLEGTSFLPVLTGKSKGKDVAYTQIRPVPKEQGHFMAYSVRTRDFRYTEWRDREKQNELVSRELFDQRHDPDEAISLADDKGFAAVVREHALLASRGFASLR
jgi:arylsulfatase A-like enzyme